MAWCSLQLLGNLSKCLSGRYAKVIFFINIRISITDRTSWRPTSFALGLAIPLGAWRLHGVSTAVPFSRYRLPSAEFRSTHLRRDGMRMEHARQLRLRCVRVVSRRQWTGMPLSLYLYSLCFTLQVAYGCLRYLDVPPR